MKPIIRRSIVVLGFAIISCATERLAVGQNQPWLEALISEIQQQPVANPPASITRYTYKGAVVYYLAARCCDIPSKLYDVNGAAICEPDGGLTGRGDGKCPDFLASRTDEQLIWRDQRK